MKTLTMLAVCLTATACTKPSLPDPRFEFPAAPAVLMAPVPPLNTIPVPENKPE